MSPSSSRPGRGQLGGIVKAKSSLFCFQIRTAALSLEFMSSRDGEEVGRGRTKGLPCAQSSGPRNVAHQRPGSEAERNLTFLGLPKGPRIP